MANGQGATPKDVAQSFSSAAQSYDTVAELQRSVGEHLLTLIPTKAPNRILDLGCGTGYFLPALAQRFPTATLLGLDIAPGMLQYARARHYISPTLWCNADAQRLPLQANSLSLMFSNLMVQWCTDLFALMADAFRVLEPGGHLICSSLGPDTLCELRHAWRQVDNYVHVNQFMPRLRYEEAARAAGFEVALIEAPRRMHYRQLVDLMRELKALGAHNLNQGRPKGLMGKAKLTQVIKAYEVFRDKSGQLPATYQVYYLVLKKPVRPS